MNNMDCYILKTRKDALLKVLYRAIEDGQVDIANFMLNFQGFVSLLQNRKLSSQKDGEENDCGNILKKVAASGNVEILKTLISPNNYFITKYTGNRKGFRNSCNPNWDNWWFKDMTEAITEARNNSHSNIIQLILQHLKDVYADIFS